MRYGADVSRVDEAEVVRRASAILGTPRDGTAADVVAICHRLDAEREYERSEDGRFTFSGEGTSGGGGERESRAAGTGVGAASNHHEVAQGHAERARAAASGTSASARASARKSEEHAALAKVAAAHDDHAAAAHHAKEAERHSVAAQMKASLHRGERPREGKATTPVENKSMKQIVADRPKTPAPKLNAKEAAATSKVHQTMKQATKREETRSAKVNTTNMGASPANARVAAAAAERATARAKTPTEHVVAAAMRDAAASAQRQAATTPIPRPAMPDHQLAQVIQKAVNEAPGRHGHNHDKVFISRAHEATQAQHGLGLQEFKSKVADLARQGHLTIARADVLGMMNKHDVQQSHTDRGRGAEAHFIQRTQHIPLDQVHHAPSTERELQKFRDAKFDFHGKEIGAEAPREAPRETKSSGEFSPKIGGKVNVGGWSATLERVSTGRDGAKVYHTSSGNFTEEHLRKHN